MATPKKFNSTTLSKAKKAGFKMKKPKKPTAGASLTALENYIVRYNNYIDRMNEKAREYDKKEADKKRKEKLKKVVSGL